MDGTLSPIVPVPSDARPTERNKELLRQLHGVLALVAVVSGRAAADVRERVGLPELVYSGNHGLERWQGGTVQVAPAVAPYLPRLQAAVAALKDRLPDSMFIEDKGATLSIHYRHTPDPAQAAREYKPVVEQIARQHELRVFQGRMIFELRPPLDINKGTVFRQLVEEYRLDAAVYLGDDTTDADALRMTRQMREAGECYSLGIGVESDDMPSVVSESADLSASGVDGDSGVEGFLAWMLEASSASLT